MNDKTQSPAAPVCKHCGNDGADNGLFLAVDLRWRPDLSAWELVERDDSGGVMLDCLECDEQTECERGSIVPYGLMIQPPLTRIEGEKS